MDELVARIRALSNSFPEGFKSEPPPTQLNDMTKSHKESPLFFSPKKFYYVLLTQNKHGDPVYAGKVINWEDTGIQVGQFNLLIYWRAFLLSISFAALFTILLIFVLKAIVAPLESLKSWAKFLSDNINDDEQPDQQCLPACIRGQHYDLPVRFYYQNF